MMSSPEKHVLESHLIWIFVPNRIVFVSPSFSLGRCSEITWRGTLGKMFIFLRRNIPEEDNMEEEEEKDNDDDILAKVTNFVDRNLRVFKVRQNFNFIGRGRRTIKGSSQGNLRFICQSTATTSTRASKTSVERNWRIMHQYDEKKKLWVFWELKLK